MYKEWNSRGHLLFYSLQKTCSSTKVT